MHVAFSLLPQWMHKYEVAEITSAGDETLQAIVEQVYINVI